MHGNLVEIRLVAFPLSLWQRGQEHVDELLREFALIAQAEEQHRSVPQRLLDLVSDLTAAYAGYSSGADSERVDALRRGLTETTLVYRVPPGVAAALRQLGGLLDEADEYCRQGSELLTLQTRPTSCCSEDGSYRSSSSSSLVLNQPPGPSTPRRPEALAGRQGTRLRPWRRPPPP